MSVTIDLLRHGETEQGGGFRGSIDDPLTAYGWEQMHTSCQRADPWQGVISSPLQRCAAFAEKLATARALPLEHVAALQELHFGDWEGRHPRDLMIEHAELLGKFWADPYAFTPPAGEHLLAFEKRVLGAVDLLAERYANQRLLVVTHGGVIRLLLARARQLPRRDLLQVEVNHAQRFTLCCESAGRITEV
ncbi:MAG TPA: histidine phosphatase family protein [Pseudomonas xinjiangensis]|uniref:Histidine phosphatase family protein n=2 Tax=root TaxID=1 RepID=A0A7V1BQ82_9GAMM|nr:histidine phosphatase family protein [Halopseudomonas xinjiangensis]HEC46172.1 histidine phosphatase family protein [Halopseudomonas xinjiangensis]